MITITYRDYHIVSSVKGCTLKQTMQKDGIVQYGKDGLPKTRLIGHYNDLGRAIEKMVMLHTLDGNGETELRTFLKKYHDTTRSLLSILNI